MLKAVLKAEEKMKLVLKGMDAVISISETLPAEFKANIHQGDVNNLTTPKEYSIFVNVQNLKNLYSMNEAYKDTMKEFAHLKGKLSAYPIK